MAGEISGSLDTNVVMRILVRDLPEFTERALNLVESGHFEVADVAIVEAVYALENHYGLARSDAVDAMKGFALSEHIVVSGAALYALDVYPLHPKLSFADCLLSATSPEPLWTFDKKLVNQTSARMIP